MLNDGGTSFRCEAVVPAAGPAVDHVAEERGALMQVGLYRTDSTGRCVWVNSRVCELFELERDEILGLGWTRRIHRNDVNRVQQSVARAVGPLRTFQIDYRIHLPVARTRWVSAFSTAIMTTGEFAGRIGIIRDVTHLRRD